ncbi:Periplasmic binding protein-related protein [Thioalkalivibrio nitratireducens DSM 14787]|uniref:Periplasmic binding protein-related protein n=1 Tax=Thioalkalivibrio nitratireducens (strain DSM 14787 / UNIQEM 213 / ALEN2) TaxID=1255043 RepID=L0DSP7_THIND|nr:PhnD/SsuA/transferrin family substrate-binding protein [Thioalkalivibrio nitratireducens]AGA32639.1 Periplasmic binding protein-related protein [Thioalkalivibrio nitratireducens DSM 14787]
MNRRDVLAAGLLLPAILGADTGQERSTFRIGLTPVFLDDQVEFLKRWRQYLERRLEAPVQFVQRASYREVTELVLHGELDVAWLCGYPYALNADRLRLLAVPLVEGRPLYRSYILVWDEDLTSRSLTDLEGRIFAFSDPLSNSGHLFPQYVLSMLDLRPEEFFRRTFFTWSHRHVVEAVAVGLAQAGAVDGFVWEMLNRLHPEITRRTRVIERSPEFAFPPLVTSIHLAPDRYALLARVFLGMHADAQGRDLLTELGLSGFAKGDRSDYDEILFMAEELQRA